MRLSGVNPGDTKKRSGWLGNPMAFPRIVPHSDGAGVIDKVGDGVDARRVGERLWVWGAQSYRPMATAAEFTVGPADQAVALPEDVADQVGACLGIPGITAHRAVLSDGPVHGATLLVHGVRGGVGSLAAQLAVWDGATVIGTVRRSADVEGAKEIAVGEILSLDTPDAAERIRALAPDGVDRVIEVSLSDNVDLDAVVLRVGGVIAAYASRDERPSFPFWPMLFDNITILSWAATTSPRTPSTPLPPTSPPPPVRARCPSRRSSCYRLTRSPGHTIWPTPAAATALCSLPSRRSAGAPRHGRCSGLAAVVPFPCR